MWELLENVNKTFVLMIRNKTVLYQYVLWSFSMSKENYLIFKQKQ